MEDRKADGGKAGVADQNKALKTIKHLQVERVL